MGPQLFSCGDMETKCSSSSFSVSLQWGHNFSVVEMRANDAVSFGLRLLQWGHNFSVVEIVHRRAEKQCVARFNGATTFQLWRLGINPLLLAHCIPLQWGHNFSVVEIFGSVSNMTGLRWLQWGHNFSVVEISTCKSRNKSS